MIKELANEHKSCGVSLKREIWESGMKIGLGLAIVWVGILPQQVLAEQSTDNAQPLTEAEFAALIKQLRTSPELLQAEVKECTERHASRIPSHPQYRDVFQKSCTRLLGGIASGKINYKRPDTLDFRCQKHGRNPSQKETTLPHRRRSLGGEDTDFYGSQACRHTSGIRLPKEEPRQPDSRQACPPFCDLQDKERHAARDALVQTLGLRKTIADPFRPNDNLPDEDAPRIIEEACRRSGLRLIHS